MPNLLWMQYIHCFQKDHLAHELRPSAILQQGVWFAPIRHTQLATYLTLVSSTQHFCPYIQKKSPANCLWEVNNNNLLIFSKLFFLVKATLIFCDIVI